jgi:hypothetical protein
MKFRLLGKNEMKIQYVCFMETTSVLSFYAPSQNCEKRLLASSSLSVRPSIPMEHLGSHWTDFPEL